MYWSHTALNQPYSPKHTHTQHLEANHSFAVKFLQIALQVYTQSSMGSCWAESICCTKQSLNKITVVRHLEHYSALYCF